MAIAVVTGCSTGIGYATALELARKGHTVYATMRAPQRSPQLLDAAQAQSLPLSVLPLDVNSDSSVDATFASIFEQAGRVDVLVNNAGVGTAGPIEELTLDDFRLAMETNYFGALRCIKAVLGGMRRQGGGCIVNVSSVAGRVATSPQAPYAASKFALEALSEILAQEVRAFNIRVAIVEPGVIRTPIFEKARPVTRDPAYPQERRLHALNLASLEKAPEPDVVAKKIVEIVDGDSWQLRYPVGPDARPFIAWRRMLTDEEWIERHGEPDDEVWADRIKQESGVDMRPYLRRV